MTAIKDRASKTQTGSSYRDTQLLDLQIADRLLSSVAAGEYAGIIPPLIPFFMAVAVYLDPELFVFCVLLSGLSRRNMCHDSPILHHTD